MPATALEIKDEVMRKTMIFHYLGVPRISCVTVGKSLNLSGTGLNL